MRWIVPAVLLALAGAAFWVTTGFDRMPPILKRGIQPADFPQLVAGLIAALTLLMVWRDPVRVTAGLDRTTLGSLGLVALFAALAPVDLFLALGIFAALLSVLWGERRADRIALVGFGVPVAVFFLFDLVFRIRFPRGVLTSLWYG